VGKQVAHITAKMKRDGISVCEPSEQAQHEYCEAVYDSSLAALKFYAACTPGYYSNEGNVDVKRKSYAATYPGGTPGGGGILTFLENLRDMQTTDDTLRGFDYY
jgi:cyclohexanone monooxygenase